MEDKIVIDNTQVFSDSLEIDKTKPITNELKSKCKSFKNVKYLIFFLENPK